jgi:hypothetical protein
MMSVTVLMIVQTFYSVFVNLRFKWEQNIFSPKLFFKVFVCVMVWEVHLVLLVGSW